MREQNDAIPAALDEAVLRCVSRDKADRWTSVRALSEALAGVAGRR